MYVVDEYVINESKTNSAQQDARYAAFLRTMRLLTARPASCKQNYALLCNHYLLSAV